MQGLRRRHPSLRGQCTPVHPWRVLTRACLSPRSVNSQLDKDHGDAVYTPAAQCHLHKPSHRCAGSRRRRADCRYVLADPPGSPSPASSLRWRTLRRGASAHSRRRALAGVSAAPPHEPPRRIALSMRWPRCTRPASDYRGAAIANWRMPFILRTSPPFVASSAHHPPRAVTWLGFAAACAANAAPCGNGGVGRAAGTYSHAASSPVIPYPPEPPSARQVPLGPRRRSQRLSQQRVGGLPWR